MATFFTSLPGSLIHPIAMSVLIVLWFTTWILGIQARTARLSPEAESVGLLSGLAARSKAHHKLSATLVFLTTLFCFVGMGNTFMRTGRLFPGPHLYGGLAVLLALSLNVAFVPWFKDAPGMRLLHAANGIVILILLAVQVKCGLPILVSVWNTVR